MKNSEKLSVAMMCVLNSVLYDDDTKLEVLEKLIGERNIALMVEKREEERDSDEKLS